MHACTFTSGISGLLTATTALLLLATLLPTAHANIAVHSPVASTKAHGGDKLPVEWADDGTSPTLASYGSVSVFLCTGSSTVQYKLQTLKEGLKMDRTSAHWKIDPMAGPNSDKYFLRFEGTNLLAGNVPPMAFSARFTLTGMKGSWNATVTATNQGAADPASGSPSSKGMSTVASKPSSSPSSSSSSRSGAASTPTLKPASSASMGAADRRTAASVLTVALLAALVAGSAVLV